VSGLYSIALRCNVGAEAVRGLFAVCWGRVSGHLVYRILG
jgi:hypothetical protein